MSHASPPPSRGRRHAAPPRRATRARRAPAARRARRSPLRALLSTGAILAVAGLVAGFALAPPPQKAQARGDAASLAGAQTLTVATDATAQAVQRDGMSITPGAETLALGGTNQDWAKLVLMFGGWPQTEENVTVLMRWMRQENGTSSWWNRNNPLNNGYGSGGGSGLGSYDDLTVAAQMCAENLVRQGSYDAIVASLASSGSADATAAAIWASPWASSHYANGSHWSTSPVDIVKAPDSAW